MKNISKVLDLIEKTLEVLERFHQGKISLEEARHRLIVLEERLRRIQG